MINFVLKLILEIFELLSLLLQEENPNHEIVFYQILAEMRTIKVNF